MTPPFKTASNLSIDGIAHGFFSRRGGVSEGIYASLNVGPGSNDDPAQIEKNRALCVEALGLPGACLHTGYQIHSARVVEITSENAGQRYEADGFVTKESGIILGALAADCMPWLFVDCDAQIIGAAHAGWRGALAGVLENTIEAMIMLGARPQNIHAAVGPALRQRHFEVGLDLVKEFSTQHDDCEHFFAAGNSHDKRLFDLVGFGSARLQSCGVTQIEDLDICTLDHPAEYFSYRASRRQNDPDYGRNLSAIAIL